MYIDFRDGNNYTGDPPVLHRNDSDQVRQVAVPRRVTLHPQDWEHQPVYQFTVPPLHELRADGTIRRITGYIPPRTATTPEENTAMPAAPAVITTLEEAQAALRQFQDVLAAEARQNGHPTDYGTLIQRAIAEIPGLRAANRDAVGPQGTLHLQIRVNIPEADGTLGRDAITSNYNRLVRTWANENGHQGLSTRQQHVAYFLAHPEIAVIDNENTSGQLDSYSVTNNRTGNASTNGRVEFVTE